MKILGIESSCDETSAAVLLKDTKGIQILSNIIVSSAELQAKYGGIIPEQAAREQLKSIIPVIKEALEKAKTKPEELDAIAVTEGPGLIGSLLIGVETAKVLSYIWNKPLIPVNHLLGHLYANWVENNPQFPLLGLLVSGGHTDLVLFKNHMDFEYLGGTRDDAAGECFDKCARLIGFPYPGGPKISAIAANGDPKAISFTKPMLDSQDFDFSFSGLKTAFANYVKESPDTKTEDLAASLEETIVEVLVKKTTAAAKKYEVNQLIVAGGVAANQKLREKLQLTINNEQLSVDIDIPPTNLCTDNGAMIASAAFFLKPIDNSLNLQANPNLTLET